MVKTRSKKLATPFLLWRILAAASVAVYPALVLSGDMVADQFIGSYEGLSTACENWKLVLSQETLQQGKCPVEKFRVLSSGDDLVVLRAEVTPCDAFQVIKIKSFPPSKHPGSELKFWRTLEEYERGPDDGSTCMFAKDWKDK